MNEITTLIPLSQLAIGRSGIVGQVLGQPEQVHRLDELGIREGVNVEMVQRGNPCIIRVSGGKFCFRANDALSVLVAETA